LIFSPFGTFRLKALLATMKLLAALIHAWYKFSFSSPYRRCCSVDLMIAGDALIDFIDYSMVAHADCGGRSIEVGLTTEHF
jgi:hypothetical protein